MAAAHAFNQPKEYVGLFRHFSGYYQRFLDLIVDAGDLQPGFVLDLACGTGDFTALIAGRFSGTRIVGLDMSSTYVDFARSRFSGSDINFYVSPAQSLPGLAWAGEVDTIFIKGAYHLIEHLLPIKTFVRPTFRSLRTIVIIEKSHRSLESYEVPHSAKQKRETYVSQETALRRMQVPPGATLRSLSYGEAICVPARDYVEAVRSRQFSYLDVCSNDELEQWAAARKDGELISLFEENVANIYQL